MKFWASSYLDFRIKNKINFNYFGMYGVYLVFIECGESVKFMNSTHFYTFCSWLVGAKRGAKVGHGCQKLSLLVWP